MGRSASASCVQRRPAASRKYDPSAASTSQSCCCSTESVGPVTSRSAVYRLCPKKRRAADSRGSVCRWPCTSSRVTGSGSSTPGSGVRNRGTPGTARASIPRTIQSANANSGSHHFSPPRSVAASSRCSASWRAIALASAGEASSPMERRMHPEPKETASPSVRGPGTTATSTRSHGLWGVRSWRAADNSAGASVRASRTASGTPGARRRSPATGRTEGLSSSQTTRKPPQRKPESAAAPRSSAALSPTLMLNSPAVPIVCPSGPSS